LTEKPRFEPAKIHRQPRDARKTKAKGMRTGLNFSARGSRQKEAFSNRGKGD